MEVKNEPILGFWDGSAEREDLLKVRSCLRSWIQNQHDGSLP